MTEIQTLRAKYKELYGKKPYAGWKEDKLKEKIEEKSPVVEEPTEEVPTVQEYQTEKDLFKEEQEKQCITYDEILDSLYKKLTDGRYRRAILDIKEKNITNKDIFKLELEKLTNLVYEGEGKAIVKSFLQQL